MESTKKQCPYCGESIDVSEIKCKHCGEWLSEASRKEAEAKENERRKAAHEARMEEIKAENKDEIGATSIFSACLAYIVFMCIIIGVIALILHLTVPSQERMEQAIVDKVYESVKDESTSFLGLLSEDLGDVATMAFDLDDNIKTNIIKSFYKVNEIEIDESWCWSVGRIYNAESPSEGSVASFGILGMVFPLVDWDDFVMIKDNQSHED